MKGHHGFKRGVEKSLICPQTLGCPQISQGNLQAGMEARARAGRVVGKEGLSRC